jgi:lysophospholipase L1-like esterase
MNRLCAIVLCVLFASSPVLAQDAATRPAAAQEPDVAAIKLDTKTGRPNERFMQMHREFVERASKGDVEVLFVGDSITAGWSRQKQVWDQHFGKYNPANFGIGGDRTQHVLWRMLNGELEGIKPKVVVLLIGTNNSKTDPPDKIVSGVEKIVQTIREKTDAKVLLLAIFPRGETAGKAAEQRATIDQVNARLAKLDNGKNIRFLDIGEKFLQPDKSISKEIMNDYLHLTTKGYEIWAGAIDQPLTEMVGEK